MVRKPWERTEPEVKVTLPPELSGNILLLSVVTKQDAGKLVAEAVDEYLRSRGYDPHRKPKLEFP